MSLSSAMQKFKEGILKEVKAIVIEAVKAAVKAEIKKATSGIKAAAVKAAVKKIEETYDIKD